MISVARICTSASAAATAWVTATARRRCTCTRSRGLERRAQRSAVSCLAASGAGSSRFFLLGGRFAVRLVLADAMHRRRALDPLAHLLAGAGQDGADAVDRDVQLGADLLVGATFQ